MEADRQERRSSNGHTGSNRTSVKARASARIAKSGSIASDTKSASETSKSVNATTPPPMSIKPYRKPPPALGLEKLQRLSQAGLLHRTALAAAQGQGGSAAPTVSPSGKKLTSLQKLFATVSPRSSVYLEPPAASDADAAAAPAAEKLEPPKKHEVQESEEVAEVEETTVQEQQPARRRSSLLLVSHDDGEFEMTTVVSVDDVEVAETAENVEPRAAEEPPSAEKRSSYLQLLNRRSKYPQQHQQQRNRTRTDSTATAAAVPAAGAALAPNARNGTKGTEQTPTKQARPTSRSRRAGSTSRLRKDPADEAKQSLMRLNAKLKLLSQQREAQLQQQQQQQQREQEAKEDEQQPRDEGHVESAPGMLQVETQPTSDAVSQSTVLLSPSPSPHRTAPKFQLDQIQAVAAEVRKHATSQHAFRAAMRNPVFRILIATKLGSASNISQQFASMTRSEQLKMLRDVRVTVDRLSAEGLSTCLLEARQQLVDEELNRVKKMLYQKLETIKPRLATLTREELVTLAQQRITLGALVQQYERSVSSSQKYDSERHWAELLARQSLQREATIEARRRQLEEELKLVFWEERANTTQAYEDKVEALLGQIQRLRDSVVSLHARIHKQTEESAFTMAAELGIDAHRLGETGAQRYLELYRHVARALRRLDPRARSETLSTN